VCAEENPPYDLGPPVPAWMLCSQEEIVTSRAESCLTRANEYEF
jgi:hypothetical protein